MSSDINSMVRGGFLSLLLLKVVHSTSYILTGQITPTSLMGDNGKVQFGGNRYAVKFITDDLVMMKLQPSNFELSLGLTEPDILID